MAASVSSGSGSADGKQLVRKRGCDLCGLLSGWCKMLTKASEQLKVSYKAYAFPILTV